MKSKGAFVISKNEAADVRDALKIILDKPLKEVHDLFDRIANMKREEGVEAVISPTEVDSRALKLCAYLFAAASGVHDGSDKSELDARRHFAWCSSVLSMFDESTRINVK